MRNNTESRSGDSAVITERKAWSFIQEINRDNLDALAIADGAAEYTYQEMFRQWARYAAVFSALGMTEENRTRAGLFGATAAETVFAFYGLNMVGAEVSLISPFSSMSFSRLKNTIRQEKLTDIILTDDFLNPELLVKLQSQKNSLGLKHIILLHIPMYGSAVDAAAAHANNMKYLYLQQYFAPFYMDTMLAMYADRPISYAPDESRECSVIIHTSGTTTGTGKPIPLSDAAFNSAGNCYNLMEDYEYLKEGLVCGMTVDLSNAYGIVNQVHAPFAAGGSIVTVPGASFNPNFYKAIPVHRINLLFGTASLLEMWMKIPDCRHMDFSSLRLFVSGGTFISTSDKKRYLSFLREHGGKDADFISGYGLSELGGACILSLPDPDDDSLGRPIPGIEICLFDEEKGIFLSREDAPADGVLYLHADSMTGGQLDGEQLVRIETVSGKPFVCTNDLVHLDPDGKIIYLGRANRFFLHEDGAKYDAGRVETEFVRQAGIESCGIVPVYVKTTHDNIPMLCVKTVRSEKKATETVRDALTRIFILEKTLPEDQVPYRAMILDEFPRNPTGKIDIRRITTGEVLGKQYKIESIKHHGKLTGFRLQPLREDTDDLLQEAIKSYAQDAMESGKTTINHFKEEFNMEKKNDPFAFWNSLNQMGSQMMKTMGENKNGWNGMFGQAPMFQNWMPFMQQMNPMGQMPQMNPMGQMPQMNYFMNQMQQMPQMNFMNQMQQMMAMQVNQMYEMTKQMSESMHRQNIEMLEMLNKMAQQQLARYAPEKKEEGAQEDTAAE